VILAIFQNERAYDGNENFLTAVYPMPSVSKLEMGEASPLGWRALGDLHPAMPTLFREDSFDPTTRLRRGRFYTHYPQKTTYDPNRVNHYPYGPPTSGGPLLYNMDCYRSLQPTGPIQASNRPIILLGDGSYTTAWRIIGGERLFNGETMLTLMAARSPWILPELTIGDNLSLEKRTQILQGFERTLDAAHKYLPVPIVDVCREFARIMLAAWLPTVGVSAKGDLSELLKSVPNDRVIVRSSAYIINRLHSRGKSSEQQRQENRGHSIRAVSDSDAELSLGLIACLLREFGWAA
jgi:hypothetical protein